jgi:hypothetical protein
MTTMPNVPGLKDECREQAIDGAAPLDFECKSAPGGLVRLRVENGPDWAAGVYQTWHALTLEVDAAKWLPIFRACVAKCEEVVATQQVGTLAADLAGRIAEHGAAT